MFFACYIYYKTGQRKQLLLKSRSMMRKLMRLEETLDPMKDRLIFERLAIDLDTIIMCHSMETKSTIFVSQLSQLKPTLHLAYSSKSEQFYYIRDLELFQGYFACKFCERWFRIRKHCVQHEENSCPLSSHTDMEEQIREGNNLLIKITNQNGPFRASDTIIDQLQSVGIQILPSDFEKFAVDMFACYDTESVLLHDLEELELFHQTECYTYLNRHRTIMICISDNVVNQDKIIKSTELEDMDFFAQFVDHLLYLQNQYSILMRARLSDFFLELDQRIILMQQDNNDYWMKRFKSAKRSLEKHCETFNVIAFNSRFFLSHFCSSFKLTLKFQAI